MIVNSRNRCEHPKSSAGSRGAEYDEKTIVTAAITGRFF